MSACPSLFQSSFFRTENRTAPRVNDDNSFLGTVAQLQLLWLKYDLLMQWLNNLPPSEFG